MDSVASPAPADASHAKPLPEAVEQRLGLVPSRGSTAETDTEHPSDLNKPPLLKYISNPAYGSPLRHHKRNFSAPKQVKESLNARSEYITSEDDGVAEHRINQYVIKQEIGRGSFGAVHLAVDQYGTEYAVKEFSKARLRKRAQSHTLRKPLKQRRRGSLQGFNSPLHRQESKEDNPSSIDLIKEEIAIMKKLNHPNLVSLIEVLDDPSEDSLYMVMEMCKKGVVMKVGLDERADPYRDDTCRYWFRDLILAIEYLHAQGVVHRDIKPDNCLITGDDVLKVVDFGVSEMFEKDSEMRTAKSAGSPAFLPPELCVAKHGDVSGKAADIWSMGVTLYCLKYGRIPFEKTQIFDLYESIKTDQPDLTPESDQHFQDLMIRILEKDPSRRIKMTELRVHPWVTKSGEDPLLSEAENIAELVEPPTEAEMNAAITGNMRNLMTVVKAVNKFKALTADKRPPVMTSILGEQTEAHFSQPPGRIHRKPVPLPYMHHKSHSVTIFDREPHEGLLAAKGVHRDLSAQSSDQGQSNSSAQGPALDMPLHSTKAPGDPPPLASEVSSDAEDVLSQFPTSDEVEPLDVGKLPPFRSRKQFAHTIDDIGRRGHAHDPLEDKLYLYIGPSTFAGPSSEYDRRSEFMLDDDDVPIVSESPGAADIDIYETAYRDEIERILAKAREEKREPNVYLTRRVDQKLLAISGRAGRFMAGAEEVASNIDYYTQFSARRAKVAEVSRALRQAAREEYERRRQEKRNAIAQAKVEKSKTPEEAGESEPPMQNTERPSAEVLQSPTPISPPGSGSWSQTGSAWKGKATDKGRQARTSLMGFVDQLKTKGPRRSRDDQN